MLEPPEAPDQKAGADEQRDRERDLAHDERVAQPLTPRTSTRTSGAFLQRLDQVWPGRLDCRDDAEEQAREKGRDERESKDSSVNRQLVEPGQGVRRVRQQHPTRSLGDREAEHATDRREHQCFDDELPDDSSAVGAQRRANRDLALPLGRARKEQARNVAAGDEQHETARRP